MGTPVAPTITTTNVVTNVCGARRVRYSVPTTPAATATAGAATGYEWSFVGLGLGANATIDSGDVSSRVIVVLYTSNEAALTTDSVRCRYTSVCGNGANGKSKIGLVKLNAPLAPTTLTITPVAASVCDAKLYRYTAPAVLPAATATNGAATGYDWSFTGTLGLNATIDSGDATSRIILVRFTSNAAAGAGDSVRVRYNIGEGMPHINVKYYPMNLKAVAPKVVKAFKNANKPIPQSTLNAFKESGVPLEVNENEKSTAKLSERCAPSWNATKPGFYVRPGPGQQPYWFKIPSGLASGRKTVIATYTKAGRNIPRTVRNIFKIGNNVQTAAEVREHKVVMGLNKILRINNRQATRLTKKELLAIARNMNIPQVGEKTKPAEIIAWIQSKAGVGPNPNRTYDVLIEGMFYKFLNGGRVERTTNKGVRTTRDWATIPAAEQNKIAKAVIPENLQAEWNTTAKANRYNTLRAVAFAKKPAKAPSPPPAAPPKKTPSPSSAGSNMGNFEKELEVTLKLQANLGNNYKEGNETNFMKMYGKLPVGKRGKPLKANENRIYKKFVKETKALRANVAPRARFMAKIQVPNWMPANKVQAYKNLVTNLAFQKPRPAQKDIKAAVKNWINKTVPQSPPRAAKVVENVITGEMKHIPAYVPKPRTSPVIPKRTPPAKKSPKAKPVKNNRLQKEYALPKNKLVS